MSADKLGIADYPLAEKRPEVVRGKRGKGLDWTLGEDAIALGRRTGYDYALFVHAEDSFASTGRVALQVLGVAGCVVGFTKDLSETTLGSCISKEGLRTARS